MKIKQSKGGGKVGSTLEGKGVTSSVGKVLKEWPLNLVKLILISIFSLGMMANPQASSAQKPMRFVMLDFNRTSETEVLKKALSGCQNIDLLTPLNSNKKETVASKIRNLCRSKVNPELIVFSGHFAGAWSGSRGRLSLDELEALSCDPECADFFGSVHTGVFLACNNLLGTPKGDESSQEYLERLLRDHRGDFTSEQIIAASLDMFEGAGGNTNVARISKAFSGNQILLGFAGGAPLASEDGGQSDSGLRTMLERFQKASSRGNICENFEQLIRQKNQTLGEKLISAWTKSMNEVDSGKNAVGIFNSSGVQSGDGVPRAEYCRLQVNSQNAQQEALRQILRNEKWTHQAFGKIAGVLNTDLVSGLTELEKEVLLQVAQLRMNLATLLVHRFDPYRVLRLLGGNQDKTKAYLITELEKLSSKISPENQELVKETLLRSPKDVFLGVSGKLLNNYVSAQSETLKNDLHEVFEIQLGAYGDYLFARAGQGFPQYSDKMKSGIYLSRSNQVLQFQSNQGSLRLSQRYDFDIAEKDEVQLISPSAVGIIRKDQKQVEIYSIDPAGSSGFLLTKKIPTQKNSEYFFGDMEELIFEWSKDQGRLGYYYFDHLEKPIFTLVSGTDWIDRIQVAATGQGFAILSSDQKLKKYIFNSVIKKFELRTTIPQFSGEFALSSDGEYLVLAREKNVEIYRGKSRLIQFSHSDYVQSVWIDLLGSSIVIKGSRGLATLYEIQGGRPIARKNFPILDGGGVSYSSDGRALFIKQKSESAVETIWMK